MKRAFDLVVSVIGLVLLSPLFLAIAAAIKLDSRGPVFYVAKRVGRSGERFGMLKFRSMVADADRRGPGITAAGDARITRIGVLLRRSKLDELPQLINVLRGEMSLVGPRPEDPRYVALYTPSQRRVLSVRPGVTSVASLAYKDEEARLTGQDWERYYVQQIMPDKLELELAYLEVQTMWRDLGIILGTLLSRTAKRSDPSETPVR